ncbi:restriction endonuclease subunit S [Sphingomonas sp. CFBP9019]|uniref:restriction endonuclease subunit S n=1 Tax=Sphingomonas sp. CFBP9019 TaxID=3096532 RepID=UPI002A69A949|nr:restriction endonuclease subunit S [Sphingomonas sp. CFBP9019]MDY1010331.1 restriction endonuclease subunit S [Sphingomonas sp. CFBP9019]
MSAAAWQMLPLGELADVSAGQGAPQNHDDFSDDGVPFIRAGSLDALLNGGSEDDCERVSESAVRTYKLRLFPADTILFAKSGMSAKKGRVYKLQKPAYVTNHLAALVPNGQSDPNYLFRWLAANPPTHLIPNESYPSIRLSDVGCLKVPAPACGAEQRRIAAILDKADAIRARRRAALADADALASATFLHLFGDPVTNPMGWPTKPLGEVVPTIDSGWSPVCETRPAETGEWGVLKLSAVTSGRFVAAKNKALTPDTPPRVAIEVAHGDVLFTRKNTLELVAAAALVRDHPSQLMMSDLIFRLRPDPGVMEASVLWAQLSHPSLRRKAQKLAGGSAGSMPNISKERLRTLSLIVPRSIEQCRFAEADHRIHMMVEQARIALADADALYASLAVRAFRGEL